MSFAALTAFWAVSFLLVITPGADWAYVISAGLRGRRLVLPAVIGLVCGALLATLAVAAGVGSLVAQNPVLLTALFSVGVGVLAAVSAGELAPGQGAALVGALGALARVAEVDELAARVAELEKRHGKP